MKKHFGLVLRNLLGVFPYVKFLESKYQDIQLMANDYGHQPGDFYSTFPSFDEIIENNKRDYENEKILDVDLCLEDQIELLKELKEHYDAIPYNFSGDQNSELRYSPVESQYRFSDAIFLFSIINHYKPKKIIEIGSGHSSALMLDTNELFFENTIHLTFIEPFPENRLLKILKPNDRLTSRVIKSKVQEVDLKLFEELGENDILFVDSSHVCKLGSDLNHIIFNILPILKPGVLIHFHDVYFPFELPKKWISERKWFWNENYMLRAFLMNNNNYKVKLFNSLLHFKCKSWLEENMPICLIGCEETGSIWIKKM